MTRSIRVRLVALSFEESDEMPAQRVVLGMLHHRRSVSRSSERNRQDVADGGVGTVGHHHHAVGEEQGLIDIVRHHQCGLLIGGPEINQSLLQFISSQ